MKILKSCVFLTLLVNTLFASVSTNFLLENINKKDITILDTRSEDAYNGWILNNEKRRGHIPNARPFPVLWIKIIKEDDDLLKKLISQKEVIVYGAKEHEIQKVFVFLQSHGINVKKYEHFSLQYLENKNLKLSYLKNYKKIVPAIYVNKTIQTNKNVKIFEVSWGKGKKYKKAHIPTAVHINTDLVEFGPIWNYRSKKELLSFALEYGISKDTAIILYGEDTMPVSRIAIILMRMGVQDIRILNGGFKAWKNAGFEIQSGDIKAKSIKSFNGDFFINNKLIKTTKEAKNILSNKNAQLVSIRSYDEWIGKTSGYSYIKAKGRIKGAIWGESGSDAYHLEEYRSLSGKMKNQYDLEDMWKNLGIDTSKHLSFYCGTGWRATEVLLYAHLMGYENVSLYDGGWLQWSLDKTREISIEY